MISAIKDNEGEMTESFIIDRENEKCSFDVSERFGKAIYKSYRKMILKNAVLIFLYRTLTIGILSVLFVYGRFELVWHRLILAAVLALLMISEWVIRNWQITYEEALKASLRKSMKSALFGKFGRLT